MNASEAKTTVRTLAAQLVGKSLPTLTQGRPNTVLALTDEGIVVQARTRQIVRWRWIDEVIDALFVSGEVTGGGLRQARITGGYRSAFVLALLDRTPFAKAHREKREIRLQLVDAPIVLMHTTFVQEQRYRRRDLHDRYGGQRRGGISTPAEHPMIFTFTGESGGQYGYHDGWTDEGVFEYTGEGQQGDMEMVRGNAAIRDHADDGKDIHLFEQAERGHVRYIGQMVCAGFETRQAPDVAGRLRTVIVFQLVPLSATEGAPVAEGVEPEERLWAMPMEELRGRVYGRSSASGGTRREGKRNVYSRSQELRAYVLRRANGICEACDQAAPFVASNGRPYLEPHHIRRRSDGGPDHPLWVAGVCPNCHSHAHYGRDGADLNRHLASTIQEKEGPRQ